MKYVIVNADDPSDVSARRVYNTPKEASAHLGGNTKRLQVRPLAEVLELDKASPPHYDGHKFVAVDEVNVCWGFDNYAEAKGHVDRYAAGVAAMTAAELFYWMIDGSCFRLEADNDNVIVRAARKVEADLNYYVSEPSQLDVNFIKRVAEYAGECPRKCRAVLKDQWFHPHHWPRSEMEYA